MRVFAFGQFQWHSNPHQSAHGWTRAAKKTLRPGALIVLTHALDSNGRQQRRIVSIKLTALHNPGVLSACFVYTTVIGLHFTLRVRTATRLCTTRRLQFNALPVSRVILYATAAFTRKNR